MRIGVVFPQTEIGADPGAVRAYAQAAQDLGYQHLMAYDHVLGADPEHYKPWSGPYTAHTMFHEPLVLYGYLAGVAPLLELVTGVIILPQRQTALVAKQAAEVDVLTEGKFRLGVGIGWNWVEYEGLGMNFKDRARRYEEQIEVLRRLWTEPVVTFEGRYHRVVAAGLNPLPVQRPIPIWIGGSAESAIKRAAQVADGFFPQRPLEGGWQVTLRKLREWLVQAGRDPSKFGIDQRINASADSPDDWRTTALEWQALGATHLSVNTMGAGLAGPDQHIECIRQAREALRF
ncbi:MAG TPA: LLM class F420-dependent oxidoreductase [Chloroflexota bacterium]